VSGRAESRPN